VNCRPCGRSSATSSYNDRDDLVFAVGSGVPECTIDADCDDGLFCNGDETCNAGTCEAGTPPACDNGLFCDGAEMCDEDADSCVAGTPPNEDDGVACTDDSCNETTDSIDNVPNDANCDNGLFCDGAETCDAVLDCQAGSDPCTDGLFCTGVEPCNEVAGCGVGTPPNADDGVGCTDDSCNETTDSIDNVPNDANCDNGLFCDGAETCDAVLDCQAGTDPCAEGETCNESSDICEAPPAGDVHVQSIVTGTLPGSRGAKFGTASVTIYADTGAPVGAGYLVTGNFSGTFDETGLEATTNGSGIASFETSGSAKSPDVNFCVSDVAGALPYDPADNADPSFACGAPPPEPVCGNGVRETGEDCDGTDLGEETCTSQGFEEGTLACFDPPDALACTFDTSLCGDPLSCELPGAACTDDAECCSNKCKGKRGERTCN
jgi:hypothetical protein